MKRLIPIVAAFVLTLAGSTAWAGWGYAVRGSGVVVRPAVPVVTYYAPVVPAVPAAVVAPAPVVPPVPSPVLTPEALVYPGMVVYPAAVVRARVWYRPVLPAYGVLVP